MTDREVLLASIIVVFVLFLSMLVSFYVGFPEGYTAGKAVACTVCGHEEATND